MDNLTAVATPYGLDLLKSALRDKATQYAFIGADTHDSDNPGAFHTGTIETSYFDGNGVLTFVIEMPAEEDFGKYLYSVAITDDANKVVVETPTPKIALAKGIGGMMEIKAAVTGEPGEVIFKASDYVTESELRDKWLTPEKMAELQLTGCCGLLTAPVVSVPNVATVGQRVTAIASGSLPPWNKDYPVDYVFNFAADAALVSTDSGSAVFDMQDTVTFTVHAESGHGLKSPKTEVTVFITHNQPPSAESVSADLPNILERGASYTVTVSGGTDPEDGNNITYGIDSANGGTAVIDGDSLTIDVSGTADNFSVGLIVTDTEGLSSEPKVISRTTTAPSGGSGQLDPGEHHIEIPAGVSNFKFIGNGGAGVAEVLGTPSRAEFASSTGIPGAIDSLCGTPTAVLTSFPAYRDFNVYYEGGVTPCGNTRFARTQLGSGIVRYSMAATRVTYNITAYSGGTPTSAGENTTISGGAEHTFYGAAEGVESTPASETVTFVKDPATALPVTVFIANSGGTGEVLWESD